MASRGRTLNHRPPRPRVGRCPPPVRKACPDVDRYGNQWVKSDANNVPLLTVTPNCLSSDSTCSSWFSATTNRINYNTYAGAGNAALNGLNKL